MTYVRFARNRIFKHTRTTEINIFRIHIHQTLIQGRITRGKTREFTTFVAVLSVGRTQSYAENMIARDRIYKG